MSAWHGRMFPYPLLAPWTDDYEGSSFRLDVPAAVLKGVDIRVGVVFHLEATALRGLIGSGQAEFAIGFSCPKTLERSARLVRERDTVLLDAREYEEELLLTPYVVATREIRAFRSRDHASEWRSHRPGGFDLPEASILAVGDTAVITLIDAPVSSVIDLVSDPALPSGTFSVDLDADHIKIHVSGSDKVRLEAIRRRRAGVEFSALHTGLYLHAVAEAVRRLGEHEHARWAFAVRTALSDRGYQATDSSVLRRDALSIAQVLMNRPLDNFLVEALGDEERT